MAFLHCYNCNWQQDDFWTKEKNPLCMMSHTQYVDVLLNKNLDQTFEIKKYTLAGDVYTSTITWREFLCEQLEKCIKYIKTMRYRTMEEFERLNPERKCPNCGQKTLCID